MGLLNRKKQPKNKETDTSLFYDEYFREELRNHGRWYFEKIINENAALFKKDLDTTIAQVHADLKEHLTTVLDRQFAAYGKTMKDAQDGALESLNRSAQTLQQQHQQLGVAFQKHIAEQEATLTSVADENKAQVVAMKEKQDVVLQSLNSSLQALQQQQQQIATTLQKNLADQEDLLVKGFEDNMAQIIEHYLFEALGDQYDLKTQLPSIIKQMSSNKQTIVDDMKL